MSTRTSTRTRKPVKRDDYVEMESDDEEEDDYDSASSTRSSPESPTTTFPSPPSAPPPWTSRAHRNTNGVFTDEDTLAIFQFILNKIRNTHPKKPGRVAKGKVDLSSFDLWNRCRKEMKKDLNISKYKSHFNNIARKLHEYDEITLLDKADLYYGLRIRPDKSIRQELIDHFRVQFGLQGYIARSLLLDHWDLVHPDSEPEQFDSEGFEVNKFTEYDDGLMWQFVVDDVNGDNLREVYSVAEWEEFKVKNRIYTKIERSSESYKHRFNRILLPNLHLMPFDTIAKAALYYRLGYAVPESFRYCLTNATGAIVDIEGFISSYPTCPDHIVLQSHRYTTVIGVLSPNHLSTLRNTIGWADTVPYTPEEDKLIWEYILWRSRRNDGTIRRITERMSGWEFWKQFIEDSSTERSWKSLSEHFIEDLRENILDLSYDLKTKIELYYALSIPVDEQAQEELYTISELSLTRGKTIQYAVGEDFSIGNMKTEEVVVKEETPELSFLEHMEKEERLEAERRKAGMAIEEIPNSEKYPYIPRPTRSDFHRMFGRWVQPEKEDQEFPEPITTPEQEIVKTEPLEEKEMDQKPPIIEPEDVKQELTEEPADEPTVPPVSWIYQPPVPTVLLKRPLMKPAHMLAMHRSVPAPPPSYRKLPRLPARVSVPYVPKNKKQKNTGDVEPEPESAQAHNGLKSHRSPLKNGAASQVAPRAPVPIAPRSTPLLKAQKPAPAPLLKAASAPQLEAEPEILEDLEALTNAVLNTMPKKIRPILAPPILNPSRRHMPYISGNSRSNRWAEARKARLKSRPTAILPRVPVAYVGVKRIRPKPHFTATPSEIEKNMTESINDVARNKNPEKDIRKLKRKMEGPDPPLKNPARFPPTPPKPSVRISASLASTCSAHPGPPKPSNIFAAKLFPIPGRQSTRQPAHRDPDTVAAEAFRNVEEHLRTFTRKLEESRNGLTEEQTESCVESLLQMAKDLRSGVRTALITNAPGASQPKLVEKPQGQ